MTGTHEETETHPTSMAVWGTPSPVALESTFDVKVGVKCAEGCRLAGQLVRVSDEAGIVLGEARLGDAPWKDTQGLYVAELSLPAPPTEDVFKWSASFSDEAPEATHEAASAVFSFRTARPPEHTVIVEVTDRDEGTPLQDVAVMMGLYRSKTDASGLAKFDLPADTYEMRVRAQDAEAPPIKVAVDKPCTVKIQATPPRDPDEAELWM